MENKWTLENEALRVVIEFSDGSVDITSFYNKLSGTEYLKGNGTRHLFYLNYAGNGLYSNDGGWNLDSGHIDDIVLYERIWGKQLEINISRKLSEHVAIRLMFEIYDGYAGLRYQTFIRNLDKEAEKKILESDIIKLNFPNNPHTIYFIPGRVAWSKTEGSLAYGKRNCIALYHTGDGWAINPENNWATSLTAGERKGDENHQFLRIDAWNNSESVRVSTDPEAIQLVLFPGEEVEYFAVNLEVFKGDQWDGRVAVSEHLRMRYKYHDPSRLLSTNDWQWGGAMESPNEKKSDSYYRNIVIPAAAEAGFDRVHIDWLWNVNDDSTDPKPQFTADLPGLADFVLENGLQAGYWYSVSGGNWGLGRDIADKTNIEYKKYQTDTVLVPLYHSAWQQIDLGIMWKNDVITAYSHPSDNVYRKILGLREYMNYVTHKYPDFLVQTTCEVDNPGGLQNVGLLHMPDNGIAGMYLRTESADNVKDMFNAIGLFPLEGMLQTWGEGRQGDAWQEGAGWYYQFLLGRHISIYSDPGKWTAQTKALMKKFNDWRKNTRIKSILNELVRPVFNGYGDDNTGPYAWMFVDDEKSTGILIAVGATNFETDTFTANLRWLDSSKTYLIEDITLNNDGQFQYEFKGRRTGAELKETGFSIDLPESSSRGKAYWICEITGKEPQVLYADDKVISYTENWDGEKLHVNIKGIPLATAEIIVYYGSSDSTVRMAATIGPDGCGQLVWDRERGISI